MIYEERNMLKKKKKRKEVVEISSRKIIQIPDLYESTYFKCNHDFSEWEHRGSFAATTLTIKIILYIHCIV